MELMQIQTLASKCATLFRARILANADTKDEALQEERQVLETQNARFNLWADSIGVFAEGNASLDARLQEHEDIALLVVGQLLSVLRHLGRMATCKSSRNDHEEIHAAENACDDGYASSAFSESSVSSITSAASTSQASRSISLEDGDIEGEEAPPLVVIVHAVHRLHRAAMAIRRSGTASHDLKATLEQFYDDEGVNVVDVFENWTLQLLEMKFKTAEKRTLERLAHTNAERRRRFLYRKKHQRKLKGRRDSTPIPKDQTIRTLRAPMNSNTPSRVDDHLGTGRKPLPSMAHGSNAQFSQTTASRIVREALHYEPSLQSTMMSAAPSTQLLFDTSMYPPAPKVPTGAAEFFCPYCRRVQPAAERSGRRWKQHFLKDLSPFTCLVDNCHEPHRLYPDQQSWVKHMESHSIKFTCQQHPKSIQFGTEADFDQHILSQHRHLPPARLSRLRSFNSSSARLDICNCPICGFIPTKAPIPGQSVGNCEPAYKELLAHIANDLHYISMWSLDEGDDDLNVSSNASDLRVTDESSHPSDLASISFDRDLEKDYLDDRDDDYLSYTAEEVHIEDAIPEGADPEEEWFLINGKKSSYGGHDKDPKLENFVRKLQLEKLLEEGKTADPQLPCYFLPFKSSNDFFGRHSALERLEGNLHPARATKHLRTMTLTGPAGIGKTKLARQYCETFGKQYDVVLWVHADTKDKLANDFAKVGIELGFVSENSPEFRDQEHCRQLVKAWLANPLKNLSGPENSDTASWLLVFDHIIDPNRVTDYWPTNCKSGSILITSRKPMPWSTSYYPVLPVEPFNNDDSAAFLSRLIKTEQMGGGTLKLGSRAFHSPTQLIFLARMIALNRYSLEKFVQASRDDDGKKVILLLHTEDATKNQSDFSEWALESLSTKAAALLDVMAMLDPDQIVERLLTQPPDNISIPAYPKTLEEYSEAKSELLNFSFISKDRFTGNLSVVRLIQDAARKNMSEQYFKDVYFTCAALINDEWPYQAFTWRHSISRWSKCEELYPHITRLQHFSGRIPISQDDINGPYGYARLATDVLWYCHERGRFPESEAFCSTALSACRLLREFLEANPSLSKILTVKQLDRTIGEIHHNFGCITAEMNRPKDALEHQLIFNSMMHSELGEEPGTDMRLAMSFNELGVAYMINNEWEKGEECFKRSVTEMKRLSDYRKYKISLPLVNGASCYFLSGRYDEAEKILLEGLADRVEEFGENDQESFITGRFYHGLGNVKLGQGLEQESLEYLERAKDHYRMTLGRGHHRSADVAVALGRHYDRVNDEKKAIEYFGTALDAYGDRSIYNPEKTRAFFKRAKSLRKLGRDADAQEDEDRCLNLYRELVPNDLRPLPELSENDLDKLIVFWSR